MTIAAGLFLALFAAAVSVFLSRRYPAARFLRWGYGLMAVAGGFFIAWSLSKSAAAGTCATLLLAAGAVLGIVGAVRKELRSIVP